MKDAISLLVEKVDGRMAEAARKALPSISELSDRIAVLVCGSLGKHKRQIGFGSIVRARGILCMCALAAGLVLALAATTLSAETDCLACHADKDMQNAAGHSISVDGEKFATSIHGSLKCNDCHADIKDYPHPDHIAKVDCKKCHADEAPELAGSVHSSSKEHPCTSCHGDAHAIFPKSDSRSAVYPLNIPKTCGTVP